MPPAPRDRSVDVLRGFAVFTMIAANMAPHLLAPPHPFYFRLYGSFAAPLFIILSGMMAFRGAASKGHGLSWYLLRGLLLIFAGALVDLLIFQIYPFMTIDVLYLIGVSLPLAYLFSRLPKPLRWGGILLVFLLGPLLQHRFGYADYPLEIPLSGPFRLSSEEGGRILKNWLWEGWFPLFPWLGFSWVGVDLGRARLEQGENGPGPPPLAFGLFFWVLGVALWLSYPGALLTRDGYSELFYPPVPGYLLTALGLVFFLFRFADSLRGRGVVWPLEILGRSSLLIYILHLALVQYALIPFLAPQNLATFLLIYLGLALFLLLAAASVGRLKAKIQDPPFLLRFLWGG